ncbi:PREDICTED: uncharacterized protein LOC108612442 [Drosophila arizonae]|uniref:Uncharacterized protein LOC108612442 n=1 Tax=Drosophila arizonae TaxID=7263 RepID=A0ABM1P0S7_DROAR|nr:PREDICTED: uncharacterized protein LOC108612442 [Drosophila arizonae]
MFSWRNYCCPTILIIGFTLCANVPPSQAERRVEFVSSNSTYNPKYFKSFSICVSNRTLNMTMELLQPIQRGFKAHIDYQLRMPNARMFQTIFSHHVDVCATVNSVKGGIFKSWFKSMTEKSNFMLNCPVQVGTYYLRDWEMGSSLTHQFLHPGEYRGKVYLFYGKYKTKTEIRVLAITIDSVLYN